MNKKYQCEECNGIGYLHVKEKSGVIDPHTQIAEIMQYAEPCSSCNGTKINTTKATLEIIKELTLSVDAYRPSESLLVIASDYTEKELIQKALEIFKEMFLNSQQDHIAKAIIILRELCKADGFETDYDEEFSEFSTRATMEENILLAIGFLVDGAPDFTLNTLIHLCKHNKIDIEKFVEARMKYEGGE